VVVVVVVVGATVVVVVVVVVGATVVVVVVVVVGATVVVVVVVVVGADVVVVVVGATVVVVVVGVTQKLLIIGVIVTELGNLSQHSSELKSQMLYICKIILSLTLRNKRSQLSKVILSKTVRWSVFPMYLEPITSPDLFFKTTFILWSKIIGTFIDMESNESLMCSLMVLKTCSARRNDSSL
jgi:hypothetical protein